MRLQTVNSWQEVVLLVFVAGLILHRIREMRRMCRQAGDSVSAGAWRLFVVGGIIMFSGAGAFLTVRVPRSLEIPTLIWVLSGYVLFAYGYDKAESHLEHISPTREGPDEGGTAIRTQLVQWLLVTSVAGFIGYLVFVRRVFD